MRIEAEFTISTGKAGTFSYRREVHGEFSNFPLGGTELRLTARFDISSPLVCDESVYVIEESPAGRTRENNSNFIWPRTFKIGKAKNPSRRLKCLQTGNSSYLEIIAVSPGGLRFEAALHEKYAEHNTRGEFFSLSEASFRELALCIFECRCRFLTAGQAGVDAFCAEIEAGNKTARNVTPQPSHPPSTQSSPQPSPKPFPLSGSDFDPKIATSAGSETVPGRVESKTPLALAATELQTLGARFAAGEPLARIDLARLAKFHDASIVTTMLSFDELAAFVRSRETSPLGSVLGADVALTPKLMSPGQLSKIASKLESSLLYGDSSGSEDIRAIAPESLTFQDLLSYGGVRDFLASIARSTVVSVDEQKTIVVGDHNIFMCNASLYFFYRKAVGSLALKWVDFYKVCNLLHVPAPVGAFRRVSDMAVRLASTPYLGAFYHLKIPQLTLLRDTYKAGMMIERVAIWGSTKAEMIEGIRFMLDEDKLNGSPLAAVFATFAFVGKLKGVKNKEADCLLEVLEGDGGALEGLWKIFSDYLYLDSPGSGDEPPRLEYGVWLQLSKCIIAAK